MLTGEAVIFPVHSVAPFSLQKTFCFNNRVMTQYNNWKLNRKKSLFICAQKKCDYCHFGGGKKSLFNKTLGQPLVLLHERDLEVLMF